MKVDSQPTKLITSEIKKGILKKNNPEETFVKKKDILKKY